MHQILALYDQDRKGVRLFGWRREETPHLVWHVSPDGDGLIIYSALDATSAGIVIEEQISRFQATGNDFTWIVYQHDTPSDLRVRLLENGLEAEEPEAVMYLDIEQAPPALLRPVGCDVRRVCDAAGIEDVVAIHFQVWPGTDPESMARSLRRRLEVAPESIGLFVAYVDGEPASTASISVYEHGRFASLIRAGTLPHYRRQGLYTALVASRVQVAKQWGIRYVDAEASPMSRPILAKLGFRQLTEAQAYVWHSKRAAPGPQRLPEGEKGS